MLSEREIREKTAGTHRFFHSTLSGIRGRNGLLAELVQVEIEREHVDPRLAQHAQVARSDVRCDELVHRILAQVAGFGYPGNLVKGAVRADVRVEAGAGRGDQVNRDGLAVVGRGQLVDVALNAGDEGFVGLG